ncbi:MAG: hypothetical protein KAI74_00610, partial [Kiritimatiellae bacterium]|nr:hypothetical protein [Kiritimatiellia bacterium]
EIGDLGVMEEASHRCSCKLPFPILRRVEGRMQEVIVKADGENMTALFIPHLMKEFSWVDGYQIVQKAQGDIDVNIVSSQELREESILPIREALQMKLGADMRIGFERVASLQKSRSGKTPIVIEK